MRVENNNHKYVPFWSKYRPAILKMMQASLTDPQQYQFMPHELDQYGKKPKGGFEFKASMANSRLVNSLRSPEIAKDLFDVLSGSQTGSTLLATYSFEIALDKKLMLYVSRQIVSTEATDKNVLETITKQ